MDPKDISAELWREYEFGAGEERQIYRINDPRKLFIGTTTHRVVDADNTVHCCPAPGFQGCVLRWKPRDVAAPVQF